jgi:cellulose synthase/poly-beta-1,6-N-acetylglucosamine synthase-like glycosyltransferase/integrase
MRALEPRPSRQTAEVVLSTAQAWILVALGALVIIGLLADPHVTLVVLVAAATAFWTVFVSFKLILWAAGQGYRFPEISPAELSDELPSYTIFIPLYRERDMLPKLVEAVGRLSYPAEKLQVLLVLEENDPETWSALGEVVLPAWFEIVTVPAFPPESRLQSTKPNALNFALAKATGTYCVIYDAEDRPEPDQLLKAVAGFAESPDEVVCLQARLAFWNGASSWITRFYWAEYVIHYEWVLAGLSRLGLIPPLGGTSNHFITAKLREIAIDNRFLPHEDGYVGGWDPFNVTEDAELAGALSLRGYRIGMLDSTTWEKATSDLRGADKQRRRWLKGYVQTGLVYTRQPRSTIRAMGVRRWFFFVLTMLGTPLSLVLNAIFWATTFVYFVTRATSIQKLFPAPVFYVGLVLMLVGNVVIFYQLVAACLKREGYGSVKYMLLAPVWWLVTSWSALAMLGELVVSPYHWHKTDHSHDLEEEGALEIGPAPVGAPLALDGGIGIDDVLIEPIRALGNGDRAADIAIPAYRRPVPVGAHRDGRFAPPPVRFLDAEEIEALLATAEEPYRTLFATGLFAGLRSGEARGLQRLDINPSTKRLFVRWRVDNGALVALQRPAAVRSVVMLDPLPSILADYCATYVPDAPEGALFMQNGEFVSASRLQAALQRTAMQAGIELPQNQLRFRDLRHTCASKMIGAHSDVAFIASQLGHASPRRTSRIYASLFEMAARQGTSDVELARLMRGFG